MSNPRQELYDRIKESSKDEVILKEMIRLGFWESGDGQPAMSEEWIRKRGELTRELDALTKKQQRWANKEKLLHDMRKKRMQESKERQKQTKARNEEKRQERAKQWEETKTNDLIYLGDGVSGGLGKKENDSARLSRFGLPEFEGVADLAKSMGVSLGQLRFLAFHRKVAKSTHYRRFLMAKKSGGERLISAPMPRLKAAQYWVLDQLLLRVPVHDAAHGFVQKRSILTNAEQHTKQDVVINMDLRDFFPSIAYPRVKGVFRSLGYSEQIATTLGLLCTEPDRDELEIDGETYFVATGERHLPQGAPTSPAITNVLCYRLDKRLRGVAKSLGFRYTRYADDLTFSASGESAQRVKKLIWRARSIIAAEGFTFHPDKLRIMRRGARQEVTGLTVNEKPSVPRRDFRRFRALLFQLEKDGPEGKTWRGSSVRLLAAVRGYANFIKMVDPEGGRTYVDRADRLLKQYGWKQEIRHPAKSKASPSKGGLFGRLLKKLFGK